MRPNAMPRVFVPGQRVPESRSLTQASSVSATKCPECGSTMLMKIAMTLTDGSSVDFASCHKCEYRTWVQEGEELELTSVLAKAKKHR